MQQQATTMQVASPPTQQKPCIPIFLTEGHPLFTSAASSLKSLMTRSLGTALVTKEWWGGDGSRVRGGGWGLGSGVGAGGWGQGWGQGWRWGFRRASLHR